MKRTFIILSILLLSLIGNTQNTYKDSLQKHIDHYVDKHEVVKGEDRKYLQFYPIDEKYRVEAKFERKDNSPWFKMESSGPIKPMYRVYGLVKFVIDGKALQLNIYQSQSLMTMNEYKDYLFIPFTDKSSQTTSYPGGRYLEVNATELNDNLIVLDFNKVYNPYCAYVSGVYNCPIPPKENELAVPILAGEKQFLKEHH